MSDRQYGDPEVEIASGTRLALDYLEASTKTSGNIGTSQYEFEANRSTFEISNGLKFDDREYVQFDEQNVKLLVNILNAWLLWREGMS